MDRPNKIGSVKDLIQGEYPEYDESHEPVKCNDCPKQGDILVKNVVTMKGFPEIIVCDKCYNKFYIER